MINFEKFSKLNKFNGNIRELWALAPYDVKAFQRVFGEDARIEHGPFNFTETESVYGFKVMQTQRMKYKHDKRVTKKEFAQYQALVIARREFTYNKTTVECPEVVA